MASPNSAFDELASTTISNYSPTFRDNVSNNIPLYAFMDDAGAIVEEDGGIYLLENLDYGDNSTFRWFNGYDEISTTPSEVLTSANFDWKECGGNVVFNQREVSINSGRAKQHDLIKARTVNLERTMRNNIGAAQFYIGTEEDGKAFGGLQYLIADDPTTGIVGGINRATVGNEFWRNQVVDASVELLAGSDTTFTVTTIVEGMELMWIRTTRGMDTPNLVCFGNTYWRRFATTVNNNQRYVRESSGNGKSDKAKTSFPYYMFKTAKVFHDPNAGATKGYFLNTEYLKIKVHKDRNMQPDKPRYPPSQRATVIPIDYMANMVCGNCSLQGVMKD
jgi:hypothetical protein